MVLFPRWIVTATKTRIYQERVAVLTGERFTFRGLFHKPPPYDGSLLSGCILDRASAAYYVAWYSHLVVPMLS